MGRAAHLTRLLCTKAATTTPHVYDVAIVGGGMVGAALACRLSALRGPPCMHNTWQHPNVHMIQCRQSAIDSHLCLFAFRCAHPHDGSAEGS